MKNKEAIEKLRWIWKSLSDITYSPESFEAFNIAIKALEERPQGEQKIIDVPKMCEDCHSQSYSNGFDAGYELGMKDAQRHISELYERIKILKYQLEFYKSNSKTGGFTSVSTGYAQFSAEEVADDE